MAKIYHWKKLLILICLCSCIQKNNRFINSALWQGVDKFDQYVELWVEIELDSIYVQILHESTGPGVVLRSHINDYKNNYCFSATNSILECPLSIRPIGFSGDRNLNNCN